MSRDMANLMAKVLVDISALSFGYVLAFVFRFEGPLDHELSWALLVTLPFLVALKIALLFYFGAYRIFYKYASTTDLLSIVKASTIATIVAVGAAIPIRGSFGVEYSLGVLGIDWMITVLLLGGIRFAARMFREKQGIDPRSFVRPADRAPVQAKKNGARTVLIYGAGDAGEMIAREMTRGRHSGTYRVVGFVDDAPEKVGKSIHGLGVLGTRDDIGRLVNNHQVDQIVITLPSARGGDLRTLLSAIEKNGAELKIVPGLEDLVDGNVHVSDIRNVRVEDILGRDKVDLNLDAISSYIAGKRILITGAGGSIGSEICRQLLRFHPAELLLFGRGENSIFLLHEELRHVENGVQLRQIIGDVINKKKLAGIMQRYRPEIVFHAGADKHVPLMEMNPDEAVLNNVIGTKNVLEVSESFGVEKVVCISTDKAVHPTSVMGCCKRIAEMLVQSGHFKGTTGCAVRFGNVLGSRGSVIPIFQNQILRGGPITITHPDIRRYFMTISEASQLVIQAGALGQGNDLFLLDMGSPVRIIDLANDMIRLAGLEPEKDIKIKIVGLRPGEKIFEELWLSTESQIPTSHEKINRVISPSFDFEKLDREIRALTQLAVEMDYVGIVRKLKTIVPEYEPQQDYHEQHGAVPVAGERRERASG